MLSKKANRGILAALLALVMCVCCAAAVLYVSFASAEDAEDGDMLFTAESGASVLGFGSLPSYFEGTNYNGTMNGMQLRFTESNASVTYDSVIDLNALKSNGRVSPFIELQMTPTLTSQKEASHVYIRLTDVYDENTYLTAHLQSADSQTYPQYTYVAAGANGLYTPQGKLTNGGINEYGTTSLSSFYGVRTGFTPASITLTYDNEANALLVSPSESAGDVIDFDDAALGGKFEGFEGFKSGKVRLSVFVDGVIGTGTNIMVQKVAGETVEDLLAEPESDVTFAINNGGQTQFTDAVAGGTYPVADAVAYNNKDMFATPFAKVYFDGKRVPVSGGVFKTEQAGEYTIIYETYYNTLAVKSQPITVTAAADYETPPALTAQPDVNDTASVGERVILPDVGTTGGIGGCSVVKTVTFNGQAIEVQRDGKVDYFVPESEGAYTVEYAARDGRGGSSEKSSVSVAVTYASAPSFTEAFVPTTLVKGVPFRFPEVSTRYEGANGSMAVKTEILIGGTDYFGKDYTPQGNFEVTYRVSDANDPSKYSEERYNVTVVDAAQTNDRYIKDAKLYFNTQNATAQNLATGIRFTAQAAGAAQASFIKRLVADEFAIALAADGTNALTVTFYDAANAGKSLSFTYEKIEGVSFTRLLINGEYVKQLDGVFGAAPISLVYDAATLTFSNADGVEIAAPEYWSDGTAFTGFSEQVYVSFGTGESSAAGAWFEISSLCGQGFTSLAGDGSDIRTALPSIVYSRSLAGSVRMPVGSTFSVPGATAFDVFGEVTSFTLTITDPDGNSVYSGAPTKEAFDITLDKTGTYFMVFAATNSFGRTTTNRFILSAYSTEPPVINVNGGYGLTASVGDTVTIASATATDNAGNEVTVYIYVTEPDGYSCRLTADSRYTFAEAGKYVIKYYACDSEMNYTLNEYPVTVK